MPTSFEIWRSVESTPDTFFSRAAESFQLVSSDAMVKKVEVAGRDGLRHTRFQLSSNGIPVEGALYTLTSRGSRVISGVGHLVPGLNISPLPAVSEATALATAKAAVGASQWAWEVDASEPPPVGQKVAFSEDFGRSKPYRLAWKFLLRAWQPPGLWYVWVDAGSGQVMARRSALRQADTLASGKDFLGHDVTFRSQADASGYVLREGDLRKISTLRRTKTGDLDYLDTDNVWTEAEHARPVSA
ncbi:MAG TPA: hypothetical protein VLQ93_18985, partial [Myxococcaceae bacterium]|nr:hypothetical protein [Myxococcaceae bacterium]